MTWLLWFENRNPSKRYFIPNNLKINWLRIVIFGLLYFFLEVKLRFMILNFYFQLWNILSRLQRQIPWYFQNERSFTSLILNFLGFLIHFLSQKFKKRNCVRLKLPGKTVMRISYIKAPLNSNVASFGKWCCCFVVFDVATASKVTLS